LSAVLHHDFIIRALVAGTAVAMLCGPAGYFLTLRGQVFAGDALGHVAYTGAMAALVAGFDLRAGLFVATIAVGMALGADARRGGDDVAIGALFSWILGLGVLLLTYYTLHGSGRSSNGAVNVNVLFGSIFGISAHTAAQAVLISAAVGVVLSGIARPLLFATVDPAVAAASGVPVRLLGALFLGAVGAVVAEASQLIGALLVLGLLAAPGAAAARLTNQLWCGIWLSAVLAVACIWIGVAAAYVVPAAPASFCIMVTAAAIYLTAAVVSRESVRRNRRAREPARAR
jgi:zinc/manganese transport system permease protein